MSSERDTPTPGEQVARLYEQMEVQAAQAGERLVGTGGFANLLGQMAENAAAVTKLTGDAMDLVLRNLRLAGRRDVVRLARQLARTDDKLELLLQEIEELRDQVEESSANVRGGAANGDQRQSEPPRQPDARRQPEARRQSGERRQSDGSARRPTGTTASQREGS